MKKLWLSFLLPLLVVLLVATPVLAMYYAYIYINETDGNSYTDLPLMVTANVTQLAAGQYITSTGLDTRVLTGDGYAMSHMLADDKVLFVTDLEAHENKTLIFYTGAASLSYFPIIVGNGGHITTPDHAGLEPDWVFEVLASGHFDSAAGSNKNILYKEDAFRAWISDTGTLKVAALAAGGGEQWALEDDSFSSGPHSVYVAIEGVQAHLYVDDFELPVDTENLFQSNNAWIASSSGADPRIRRTFYAQGKYWAFYGSLKYKTSVDGLSWSGEQSIPMTGTYSYSGTFGLWYRDGYVHIVSGAVDSATGYVGVIYRRGQPQADGTITWSAVWQHVRTNVRTVAVELAAIAVTADGRPFVVYEERYHLAPNWKYQNHVVWSSATDGTWSTAGEFETHASYTTSGRGATITSFPSSNKVYVAYRAATDSAVHGRYYNGVSWSGTVDSFSPYNYWHVGGCVADSDDNVYVTQGGWGDNPILLWIRYADGSISDSITLANGVGSVYSHPSAAYNENANLVFLTYNRDAYMRMRVLDVNEWTLGPEHALFTTTGITSQATAAHGDPLGILYTASGPPAGGYHGLLDLNWEWNDNANDWLWTQNNAMPYANTFQLGVDGVLQLEYQPATIIQGTTLPDVSATGASHPGTITWGTNPDGVDVSISGLLTDETEDQYDYSPVIDLGAEDIIQPEPANLTGDIDMTKLERSPFRPLALAISAASGITERLAWLGMGWIALILAMLFVHLGLGANQGEQPMHLILTTLTGFGLSAMFYVTGVFPLWPVILLGMGFIASIVYERMPTL